MSTWEDEYEAFCESEDDEEEEDDEDREEYEPRPVCDDFSFEAFDPLSQSIVVHRG